LAAQTLSGTSKSHMKSVMLNALKGYNKKPNIDQ